jgi:hypothetical protein
VGPSAAVAELVEVDWVEEVLPFVTTTTTTTTTTVIIIIIIIISLAQQPYSCPSAS